MCKGKRDVKEKHARLSSPEQMNDAKKYKAKRDAKESTPGCSYSFGIDARISRTNWR
jgi:hypothetical protein